MPMKAFLISATMVLSLLTASAFAEKVPWKAGDGPGPSGTGSSDVQYDDGKATIPWNENEGISPDGIRSGLWTNCQDLNNFIGSVINCSFDKPSAQNYYNMVAKWKAPLRSQISSPADMLTNSLKCYTEGSAAMSSVVYTYLKHDKADPKKKALTEFQNKVKEINIKFIDGKKGKFGSKEASEKTAPFVELVGTTLVLHIRGGMAVPGAASVDGTGINGCSWIAKDTLKIFPALKKNYDEYN